MKLVELTHSEVTSFYNSKEVIKEVPIKDKGTIINFNIKTKINDRAVNSPVIFDKCTYFANSEEQVKRFREIVKLGSILDIKGTQNRSSYIDKKTQQKKFSDEIKVTEITPVQISQTVQSIPDELPF
jgi:hypothetical protein